MIHINKYTHLLSQTARICGIYTTVGFLTAFKYTALLLLVFFHLCNISVVKVRFHSDVVDNRELDDVLDFIRMMGKYHI